MAKTTTQIGNLNSKYWYDEIFPRDRESCKPAHYYDDRQLFCKVEMIDDELWVRFALRMALCKDSPFSLMFTVKEGLVDPSFVIGIKKGKLVKFSLSHLNFPREVYSEEDRYYYEGVSEAKDAYISLYRAYQEVASKYKTEPRIKYVPIAVDDVVSKIFNYIKTGSMKNGKKPMFVFTDFGMNTIYSFCGYAARLFNSYNNKNFLEKFAAVWLEHSNGKSPTSFMSFAPHENKCEWIHPDIRGYPTSEGPCILSSCTYFRGYNPETKKVRCRLVGYCTTGGRPAVGEVCSNVCYKYQPRG